MKVKTDIGQFRHDSSKIVFCTHQKIRVSWKPHIPVGIEVKLYVSPFPLLNDCRAAGFYSLQTSLYYVVIKLTRAVKNECVRQSNDEKLLFTPDMFYCRTGNGVDLKKSNENRQYQKKNASTVDTYNMWCAFQNRLRQGLSEARTYLWTGWKSNVSMSDIAITCVIL